MSRTHVTNEWRDMEQIVSRFESALHDGQSPSLRDFLPNAAPVSSRLLIELIAAEAEYLWKRGVSETVAEFTDKYLDLFADLSDVAKLTAVLDEVRGSISPRASGVKPASAAVEMERESSDAQRLGRYEMLEPIARPSRSERQSPG